MKEKEKKQRSFDLLGNIALVKFSDSDKFKSSEKKKFAQQISKEHKAVSTVLEKSKNFSGKLRTMKTKHLAGEKTKEALYKENGCEFRFNMDETYFSSRLAGDRNDIANKISKLPGKNKLVLVMFAGIGPYSIVIRKNSKGIKKIVSNELNKKANAYAEQNVLRNKLKDKIEFANGDIKLVAPKLKQQYPKGFDIIVMPRPNLDETFLEEGLMLSKKTNFFSRLFGKKPTRIFYHCFGNEEDAQQHTNGLKVQAKKLKRKLKILETKKVGDIAPYKFRWRLEMVVI